MQYVQSNRKLSTYIQYKGKELYFGAIGEHSSPQCPNTAAAQNGPPFICSNKGNL